MQHPGAFWNCTSQILSYAINPFVICSKANLAFPPTSHKYKHQLHHANTMIDCIRSLIKLVNTVM